MRIGFPGRDPGSAGIALGLIFAAGLAGMAAVGCGSVPSLRADAGSNSAGGAGGGGAGGSPDPGAGGAGAGSGGATGSGGVAGGFGGSPGAILVRATIGTVGVPPAPAAAGAIRLQSARLGVMGPTVCAGSICLVSGGIVP